MDVIDRLQEITKVPSRGLDHLVVAKVAEEAHEAPAEEHHEGIDGLAGDGGEGCS